jgi:hypothetical protein
LDVSKKNKDITQEYNKIEIFTDKLNKLKFFLTHQQKNLYTKLVPVIQNLLRKIEENYPYLAPILDEADLTKLYDTKDKLSFIIFNITNNLKSTFGQIDHELSMLLNRAL